METSKTTRSTHEHNNYPLVYSKRVLDPSTAQKFPYGDRCLNGGGRDPELTLNDADMDSIELLFNRVINLLLRG